MKILLLLYLLVPAVAVVGQTVTSLNRVPSAYLKHDLKSVQFIEFYVEVGGAVTEKSIQGNTNLVPKLSAFEKKSIQSYLGQALQSQMKIQPNLIRFRFEFKDKSVILVDNRGVLCLKKGNSSPLYFVLPAPDLIDLNSLLVVADRR